MKEIEQIMMRKDIRILHKNTSSHIMLWLEGWE